METFFLTEEKHAMRVKTSTKKKVFVIMESCVGQVRADRRSAVPAW